MIATLLPGASASYDTIMQLRGQSGDSGAVCTGACTMLHEAGAQRGLGRTEGDLGAVTADRHRPPPR